MSDNDKKLAFAIAPAGTGDGIPLVLIGVSTEAWEHMKNGNTHDIDLSLAGVPVKLVLFGAKDHNAVMRTLEKAVTASGGTYRDARSTDFSIKRREPNS